MDNNSKNKVKSYGRVMPRVYNHYRSNLKASSSVLTHKTSSTEVGAKRQSNSNIQPFFNDLPVVLNDYVPETVRKKEVKQTLVVKPKRTLKSLVPVNVPPRVMKHRKRDNLTPSLEHASAPSVLQGAQESDWSDSHLRECFSSRSHTRIKELKEEIKAYQETEKFMRLRSRLYKRCGVVLNDVGQVAVDKAIQAEEIEWIKKDAL